jgi:hypothetical protein
LNLDGKLYGLCHNLDKKEIVAFEIAFEQGKAHFLQLVNFEVDFETNVETTFVEGMDEGLEVSYVLLITKTGWTKIKTLNFL